MSTISNALLGSIAVACVSILSSSAIAQSVCPFPVSGWSPRLQGTNKGDAAHAVATDWDICAIYTGGKTRSSLNGQPYAGWTDAYLTRYSTTGSVIWTQQLGGAKHDTIYAVAPDSEHNVYATGVTENTLQGSPNPHVGGHDIFLVKYDQDGNLQWTRQLGTAGTDTGYGIAISSSDEIYIAGKAQGQLPLASSYNGGMDFFLAKYDTAGNHLWTQVHGTPDNDPGSGLAIGPAGNLYVVGWTDGVLNPADGSSGQTDLFVAKYTPSGTQVWVHQRGSWTTDWGRAVAVNEDGHVFVAGDSFDAFDGHANQGANDIFVVRYDANGTWRWTDFRGTAANDGASGIATSNGDPFTVGYTGGDLDGNTSVGGVDLFVIKHSRAGAWQWTQQNGTARSDRAFAVTADAGDHEEVVGATTGDLGGAMNAGRNDAFALRYDNNGDLQ